MTDEHDRFIPSQEHDGQVKTVLPPAPMTTTPSVLASTIENASEGSPEHNRHSSDGGGSVILSVFDSEQRVKGALDDDSEHTRTSSGPRRRLFAAWRLEVLSCIMVVAGLLALVGTLYAYEDRPSPKWPRWKSLNTIVSIYAIIIKAGIVLVLSEGIGQLKWSWFSKLKPLSPRYADLG
ncbi:unnamed protein product [Zymoseptoria tritici ST99CH_1A5]|uniref:Uncharacterized protein n=3 Tax=Zymoseptoria tritici TaxID=1047171 RepID=F9XCX5_ZYMTI|nr:uncharacterized protein MYCGRDRAFT_93755 [Zymoseptoria tritici IPO323]EGP86390.1 hypothetical protein MYCGRDRAFT_93755 [Zymoseptoria tritici IPO323]SMR53667.1 unnamed protein product [Zymoseptoria tritici ST99CH_1E4]SMR56025.1 unnamed protein product [Zymoseptoria tritici ST99CH_3D1]SMY25203.1 unnamed protein product [Zymoseptoria tritici ST99CH_1A5]